MRRSALLSLGALGLVPLFVSACTPTTSGSEPVVTANNPPTSSPSVVGAAPAAATTPTTTSYTPPPVEPSDPMLPTVPALPTPAVKPGPMLARPISGGTLRVLADGHTAVAADADRDLVYVVDLVAGKVTSTIALQ